MKDFLTKVFLFFLSIGIFTVFVEMQLRTMPNVYSIKKTQLDSQCGEIETLCLGNSHTLYGINPMYFSKKGYNAANVSQTFDYDQKILETYIEKMPLLKKLIITVSYSSFFEKLSESGEGEAWRTKYYSLFLKVTKPNLFEDYMVLCEDRQKLIPYWFHRNRPIPVNEFGFGTGYSYGQRNKNIEKTGIIAAKRHTIQDRGLQEEMTDILDSMIRLCESRDISVILLTTPTHQSYRNNLDRQQLNLMYSLIDSIKQQHKNVTVYDAFSDPAYLVDDFYDANHLNEIGAKKFTQKIDNFL